MTLFVIGRESENVIMVDLGCVEVVVELVTAIGLEAVLVVTTRVVLVTLVERVIELLVVGRKEVVARVAVALVTGTVVVCPGTGRIEPPSGPITI